MFQFARTSTLFVLSALTLSVSTLAHAETTVRYGLPAEDPVAWAAAVGEHHAAAFEFDRAVLQQTAQRAIDTLITQAVTQLRADGYATDADRIESEWRNTFSGYFNGTGVSLLDVGDYTPLNFWFADTYKRLRDRFGGRISMIRILEDLNTLNYTIPVVFQPRGNTRTQETWDIGEYRMHFVPFSGVVTYWGTLATCKIAFRQRPDINRFCKRAANLLSRGMVQFVAPKLSDRVYKRAYGETLETYDLNLDGQVEKYLVYLQ